MRGLILTFKRRRFHGLPDIRGILRRYGAVIFFSLTLAGGLLTGSLLSGLIDSETLKRLDILFTTNMPDRLRGGVAGAFCASFCSDFLFLLTAFLLGLCVWGVAGLPLISFFRGFGIGLSAGYLFTSYGMKGVMFYLIVLLPGVCVFCAALVYELCASFDMYRRMTRLILGRETRGFKRALAVYLRKSAVYLLAALIASGLDVLLWFAFSGMIK